jgi:hypothetical protein
MDAIQYNEYLLGMFYCQYKSIGNRFNNYQPLLGSHRFDPLFRNKTEEFPTHSASLTNNPS